ncbi:MAG: glycosyltransferase family 39 protein [Flavobacteriales bacterium]|jgi:4-amino-4-deoxy-L-arabinose transferase-like glycosyltransferase|nr:glycosyltransferase family 39 protein [Flavobacteriales bacterium]
MPSHGRLQLLIIAIAALLFIPGLGSVHLFDWDEVNFAEIAREMVVSGDWLRPQMHFEAFHEKPPLFIWMQALGMKAFGVGEFAARFPNAICGIVTLWMLYRIGEQLRGRIFGMWWALAYIGSILPHLYFRSGIIDPWFNLFIFLGLHAIITLVALDPKRDPRAINARSDRYAWIAGLFLGLAVLTKGPVGVLVPALVMLLYWAGKRFRFVLSLRRTGLIALATLLTVSAWALIDLARNGPVFMIAFFWRQVAMLTTEDAGHGGFFGYHFVVLLIGCFPASVFALQELLKPTRTTDAHESDHRRWMVILFWVVLILFSIVKTKIVHYSSLCYFPLTYLAALQLERIWKKDEGFGWSRFALGALGALIALVVIAVPFAGMSIDAIKPLFAQDPFALANLEADVNWTGIESLAGLMLLGALIAGHLLHSRHQYRASMLVVFGGGALFVASALFFFIKNIEGYSQRAAVEFFESKADERCWLLTKGYKSYVPEFYGRVMEAQPDEATLWRGPIDRPVYLACKLTHAEEVEQLGTFSEVLRRNGFVFFERRP